MRDKWVNSSQVYQMEFWLLGKKCNLIYQSIITVLIFDQSYRSCPGGRGYFDTIEKCTFNHKNLSIEVGLVYPEIFKTKIQLYRLK